MRKQVLWKHKGMGITPIYVDDSPKSQIAYLLISTTTKHINVNADDVQDLVAMLDEANQLIREVNHV